MSDHAEDKRLIVLVPDADIEQSMKGLLSRTESLKIAPVDFEVTRHVNRDNGCRSSATSYLRPYLSSCRYALVVFESGWMWKPEFTPGHSAGSRARFDA